MDFLGIIQWVMDVQQYPDSHKEEIDKLKAECSNLQSLIQMIGKDELPIEQRNQIKKNLEEAESLLKNVPKKTGIVQSFISMLPGQQTIQKLKEASDNIHRTSNNLTQWLNVRMFQSKVIEEQGDIRISKVKKLNSNHSSSEQLKEKSKKQDDIPATLIDQLGPTFEGENEEDEDDPFSSNNQTMNISLKLDSNSNIYELFEQFTINFRESFQVKKNKSQVFFTFQRQMYQSLADSYKDVNRISREHADLELIEIEGAPLSKTVQTLQVPTSTNHKDIKHNQKNSQSDHLKTTSKEEDQFATCAEVISDAEGDDVFNAPKETPSKKQKLHFIAVSCKGPNGLSIYRKRENEQKEKDAQIYKSQLNVKFIEAGSWVKIQRGERTLLFNNDSVAVLKCDKITISYTIKID